MNEAGLQGAEEGAATGSAAGPWGSLIGAGVGFVGGMMRGKAQAEQARRKRAALERMRGLATPEHLKEVMDHLQPLMRQIVESGLGPQFKQNVDESLAAHGLTGTGAGEALRTSAQAAPAIFAGQEAAAAAPGVVQREMNAEGATAELEPEVDNPLMGAILGAARGYISGKAFGKNGSSSSSSQTPVTAGSAGAADAEDPLTSQIGDTRLS